MPEAGPDHQDRQDASCSFRGVVWNNTRNTVLGQTASGAALAVGASLKYEAAVVTPFDVAARAIYVGFTRNPTGAMQFGFDNTSSHYDDNGSSNDSSRVTGRKDSQPDETGGGAPDRCWTRDFNLHHSDRGPR